MRRKNERRYELAELAEQLGARLVLNGAQADRVLTGLNTLDQAGPDDLSFAAGERHLETARSSRAGAIITGGGLSLEDRPCLVVDNAWKALLAAFDLWYPDEPAPAGIHPTAVVDSSARLGAGVSIGPLAVVEAGVVLGAGTQVGAQCFIGCDVRVGEGCLFYPGVRLMERVQVGRGVIIHSGAVIGADGFKYEEIDGMGVKIPQVGTVILEDGVEIGANTCVDRAFINDTRIGAGTKLDNLVQIGHNCQIGRMCFMAGQVGISGSTTVGDGCIFWGQSGIRDQAKIGNRAVVLAHSGVKDDIADGEQVFGTPAMPVREAARIMAAQKQLPDILKRLRAIEKKMGS